LLTFHLLPAGPWPRDRLLQLRSPQAFALLRRLGPRRLFTTVSATDRQRLCAAFPDERIELVRNAAPLPPLLGEPETPVEWAKGAVRLLSVARISRRKGFDRLARALSAPALRDLRWHWVIVGDGEERPALEELIAAEKLSDRVTFAGARSAHDVIASANILVSPSHAEGMPLVPLEAIAAGVPVIASRIPAHEELFGANASGLLPVEESEWPAALARFVGSEAARATLEREQEPLALEFGRQRMWERYDALYREHGLG
jgi:glycosyltransferase involved in cell wall biosynthesis